MIQGVNRLFVLLFGNIDNFLPKVEIKDYNVMIKGQNFLIDQLKMIYEPYDNVWKIKLVKGVITQLVVY